MFLILLSSLKVITTLTDKKNSKAYVPYRDSKLTMLLMDSLGLVIKLSFVHIFKWILKGPYDFLRFPLLSVLWRNRPNFQLRNANHEHKEQTDHPNGSQGAGHLQSQERELVTETGESVPKRSITKVKLLLLSKTKIYSRVANGLAIEIPDFLPLTQGERKLHMKSIKRKKSKSRQRNDGQKMEIPLNKIVTEY